MATFGEEMAATATQILNEFGSDHTLRQQRTRTVADPEKPHRAVVSPQSSDDTTVTAVVLPMDAGAAANLGLVGDTSQLTDLQQAFVDGTPAVAIEPNDRLIDSSGAEYVVVRPVRRYALQGTTALYWFAVSR